jgi:CDGSH-type Zn-finger protein
MKNEPQKITVRPGGPYIVRGGIPLARKKQVMSEHGEPLDWQKERDLSSENVYRLCRCGQSGNKPFCDGTHTKIEFDGTELADTGPISARRKTFRGPKITIEDDHSICIHSGFCGNRITNIWKMQKEINDSQVLAQIIAMIEKCPSGTLAYTLGPGGEIIELDLPKEVAVISDGPLWITGGILVERSDLQPIETRNRVTLCRCGASAEKPLCDGSHKDIGFSDS